MTQQMEKLETSSKVERHFPQRGRTGYARERKETQLGQSCKESSKRETEIYAVPEGMAQDAKVEDGDKSRLTKALKQLRKDREEESAARELLEEMRQKRGRGTCESLGIGADIVPGARGIHVLMGPRNEKTTQPQQ